VGAKALVVVDDEQGRQPRAAAAVQSRPVPFRASAAPTVMPGVDMRFVLDRRLAHTLDPE